MIKIVPDKEGKLTQWDLNRKVIVTGYEGVAEVHFASPGDDHGAYVVELIDGKAKIPNILLTMAGTINVYVYPADRTVFATALWVMAREKPDDYVYTETEVLNWRTLDEKIGDLAKLTTTAKENLVAAINEVATKGMASIYMRVAEGYIEYSGDGVNWKQLIAVAELKGEKGDKGDPGAQGIQGDKGDKGDKGDPGSDATVDIVTPTAESTDTQAASAKAVWDMLGGGGSGTDISLGVTGASVGDIIKVKAVDSTGKPTAWEAVTAKLANPNALTFTGAVTGSYDGSAPLSVEIPSGGGDSGWEYLGEFTIDTQPTFEIGKYNLFYVTGYATLDAANTNAYLRPSIDGTRHFPWTIAFNNATSKMFFGLFAPDFSIAYFTNGSNYAGLTTRGNGTLSMTESDDLSKGTAYITLSGGGAGTANLVEYKMKIFGKP